MTTGTIKRLEPCNAPKADIEVFAERVRRLTGLTDNRKLPDLIKRLGGRIRAANPFDPSDEDDLIVVNGPNDFEVVVSAFTSTVRDRFTLAHELGHYFLHAQQGQIPLRAKRQGSDRAEWEANWFAASFLMPADDFKARLKKSKHNIAVVAEHFAVSQQAAEIRKKSLGL
jgi:predicted transcriptional regulator